MKIGKNVHTNQDYRGGVIFKEDHQDCFKQNKKKRSPRQEIGHQQEHNYINQKP